MARRSSRIAGKKEVHPALHDLVQRVGRTRRKQVQRILARALEILPHYRGLSAAARKNVRNNVLYQLGLFYRASLLEGRKLTSTEIERSRQNARLRASQGIPLAEFLGVYQISNSIIWEDLIASVRSSPVERARLFDRVATITDNQSQLMTAVTEAYVEERESLSHFRERDLDDFFRMLLSEDIHDGFLHLRAKALGIRSDERHTVVFFRPAALLEVEGAGVEAENVRRLLRERTREMAAHVGRTLEGFALLIPGEPDTTDLTAIVRSVFDGAVRVGIGRPGPDIAGLRRSAQEALRAIEVGSNVRQQTSVHRYQDLAVLDLVRIGSPEAEGFMESVLGDLVLPGSNKPYLETLRELARSGFRIKNAAAALSIHPHTLSYRLKQIRSRFGIDVDGPETRLRVQLALVILDSLKPST